MAGYCEMIMRFQSTAFDCYRDSRTVCSRLRRLLCRYSEENDAAVFRSRFPQALDPLPACQCQPNSHPPIVSLPQSSSSSNSSNSSSNNGGNDGSSSSDSIGKSGFILIPSWRLQVTPLQRIEVFSRVVLMLKVIASTLIARSNMSIYNKARLFELALLFSCETPEEYEDRQGLAMRLSLLICEFYDYVQKYMAMLQRTNDSN